MEVTSPFALTDLPSGEWAVSWPGFEYQVVNTVNKAQKLLEILFNDVGVDRAMLSVMWHNEVDLNRARTLEIDAAAWHQHSFGVEHIAGHIVLAAKFTRLDQAEEFKRQFEKRLLWRRLGGEWK